MLPAIQIGPAALPTGPLIILIAFMLALEVAHRAAARLGMKGDDVYNLGYVAAGVGLLAARLGYVLQNWVVFSGDLRAVISLTPESLSPGIGLAAGLIAAYAFAQRHGLDNLSILDALAPGLLVLAAGLALAALANGAGYGSPTALPWGIELWGARRHPVQVYHLLAALATAVLLARAGRPFPGARFGLFMVLFAGSLLFLEAFHGDSTTLADGLRSVQVAALAALLAALLLLRWWATWQPVS